MRSAYPASRLQPLLRPLFLALALHAALPAVSDSPATTPAAAPASIPSALDLARQLNEAFVEVSERAAASVVVVRVAQKIGAPDNEADHPLLDSMPEELRREYRDFLELERQNRERFGPRFNGEGSGIIYREDGHILTNAHVVDGAERVRVRLRDGREFDAEVRGSDPDSDIAILRLKESVEGLRPARFGNSDAVRVGEFAIAIGAPYELEFSVTFGHISAKGRAGLTGSMMDEDFLQTDANINPGNSGGPLLNLAGEVVGVNSMIRGVGTGICFAIPSNLAREVAEQLVDTGKFKRSWLGVEILTLRDHEELRNYFAPLTDGVVVRRVVQDGPAAKAQLQRMDVIRSVDGRSVSSVPHLRREITRKKPGSDVRLAIQRDGQPIEIVVQPEAMPDPEERVAALPRNRRTPRPESESEAPPESGPAPEPVQESAAAPPTPPSTPVVTPEPVAVASILGLTVQASDPDLASRYRFGKTEGVVVTAIELDSPLANYSFQPGDLIYEVNRRPTKGIADLTEALQTAQARARKYQIRYLRGGRKLSAMVLVDPSDSADSKPTVSPQP
jgi:serine protease Do